MSSKRLPPRERILLQALREFARYGFFGARVAAITRAARVSPRMLFYYFKSKKGLFTAVQESIWKRSDISGAAPQKPVDDVSVWYQFYSENLEWARIVLWEGLEGRKMLPKEEAQRRKIWQSNLERMGRNKGRGGWPVSVDSAHLLLSLLAVQLAPMALPLQARMLTGLDPFSNRFIEDRKAFLKQFVEALTGGTKVNGAPITATATKGRKADGALINSRKRDR